MKNKKTASGSCVSEDTKCLVPIESILITKDLININIACITVQASYDHLFAITRKGKKEVFRADSLRVDDLISTPISMLSPGNRVLGAGGKTHKIISVEF